MKNILVVVDDALRKDFLSTYGYPFHTTPNLEKLIKNAYVFSSAHTCSSWTGTAVTSLISGLSPSEHGYLHELQIYTGPIRINQDKNYYNFCLSSNPWLHETLGFKRGWDEHFISDRLAGENLTSRAKYIISGLKCPFLGYIHFMENHEPYDDHWNLAKHSINIEDIKKHYSYKLNDTTLIQQQLDKLYRFSHKHFSRYSSDIRKSSLAHQSENSKQYTKLIKYISCVYKFDYFIGDLINFLQKLNILDETILIILSDHGEGFGNRKGVDDRHGYSLYEETLRIPLIIYNPNFESRIIKDNFSICSILQIIQNIQMGKDEFIKAAMFSNENIAILKRKNDIKIGAIMRDGYKLIKNFVTKDKEGFNLSEDPDEKFNTLGVFSDKFLVLEKRLNEEMIKAEENEGKQEDFKAPGDEELKQGFRALGYIN